MYHAIEFNSFWHGLTAILQQFSSKKLPFSKIRFADSKNSCNFAIENKALL